MIAGAQRVLALRRHGLAAGDNRAAAWDGRGGRRRGRARDGETGPVGGQGRRRRQDVAAAVDHCDRLGARLAQCHGRAVLDGRAIAEAHRPEVVQRQDAPSRARRLLDERGVATELEVDGGVKPDNAANLVRAGATVLVAGSSVFNRQGSIATNIAALRDATSR